MQKKSSSTSRKFFLIKHALLKYSGFGGTANVRETIRRMASIKAAAITIEDQ